MSFSDAIGQIDQIVQWEQQLMDPAAATQTTSTGGTTATEDTGSTSSTDASSNSTFAQTLAQAQAQDATSAATSTDSAAAASTLDPTATAAGGDTLGSTSSSSLLGGGDSQLLSLLSGLNSSSADEAAGATGATSSTGSSDELSELEQALQASNTSATGSTASTPAPTLVEGESGISGGQATSADDPRIQAMTEEANALVGKPYVWGGGHDGWSPSTGYDCSGFVSAVLHAGGYLSTPQDTTSLPGALDMAAGPGRYVTVYDRTKAGQQGHTIINIDGQFYEAGGEAGSWGGGGGVEQIATPSAKYLSTFDTILHPAGL
jgi:cell wall-associated NlpC family hydrolase